MVALPRSHRLAKTSRIQLASLAEDEFVMLSRKVSPVYFGSLVASCRESGFSHRVLHEVRTVVSQIALVAEPTIRTYAV